MPVFHLSVKTVSRADGRSATAAAAYRAGAKIVDERTGEIHDYRRRSGVEFAALILPTDAPAWASDRGKLWNAAEESEKRKNSTVAREFEIALPAELSAAQRQELANAFAQEIAERHRIAVDLAVHAPGKEGDNRNHHAHILCTTRRLTGEGFGEKSRELDERNSGEVDRWRARFAELQNQHLARAGLEARVDHRSLQDQGIDRAPTVHLGPVATAFERRTGDKSEIRIRAEQAPTAPVIDAGQDNEIERLQAELDAARVQEIEALRAAFDQPKEPLIEGLDQQPPVQKMKDEIMKTYLINPRPQELGGGWSLSLLDDDVKMGGAVFPVAASTEDPSTDTAYQDALDAAYEDALAEGENWVNQAGGVSDHQDDGPRVELRQARAALAQAQAADKVARDQVEAVKHIEKKALHLAEEQTRAAGAARRVKSTAEASKLQGQHQALAKSSRRLWGLLGPGKAAKAQLAQLEEKIQAARKEAAWGERLETEGTKAMTPEKKRRQEREIEQRLLAEAKIEPAGAFKRVLETPQLVTKAQASLDSLERLHGPLDAPEAPQKPDEPSKKERSRLRRSPL